jgi:hypothetical protein
MKYRERSTVGTTLKLDKSCIVACRLRAGWSKLDRDKGSLR